MLHMKSNEYVQDFFTRVVGDVTEIRIFGDTLQDQTIVLKILRSMTPRFDHIVEAIEEAKYLNVLSIDELSGSLQAHEVRLNRSTEKSKEKDFQVKGDASLVKEGSRLTGRGRGHCSFKVQQQGRGRGRSMEKRPAFQEHKQYKGSV